MVVQNKPILGELLSMRVRKVSRLNDPDESDMTVFVRLYESYKHVALIPCWTDVERLECNCESSIADARIIRSTTTIDIRPIPEHYIASSMFESKYMEQADTSETYNGSGRNTNSDLNHTTTKQPKSYIAWSNGC
jgi:hypothetical protein